MIVPTCWGKGYATEAARTAVRFGFEHLGLNRIWSYYMVRNPASGRVLAKVGMKREGLLREHVRKNEAFEDVAAQGAVAGGMGEAVAGVTGRLRAEPRTLNLELRTLNFCGPEKLAKATQSHPKATPRPVDRHRIGTPKPP
jgi:hypothetical protein